MKASPPDVKQRRQERVAKQRHRELRTVKGKKADVQRIAGVSERAVYKWYRAEMSSAKIAAAHAEVCRLVASAKAS